MINPSSLAIFFVLNLYWTTGYAEICPSNWFQNTLQMVKDIQRGLLVRRCPDCKYIKPSCNLDRTDELPKIIIIGEIHTDDFSKDFRTYLFNQTNSKAIYLAAEPAFNSTFYPWLGAIREDYVGQSAGVPTARGYLFGIESPMAEAITATTLNQAHEFFGKLNPNDILTLANETVANPLINRAFDEITRERPVGISEQLITDFRACMKNVGMPSKPRCNFHTSVDTGGRPLGTKELTALIHKKVVSLFSEKFPDMAEGFEVAPMLTKEDATKFGFVEEEVWIQNSRADRVINHLRDRDFSQSVLNLVCEMKGKTKTLFILVGINHAPRIAYLLRQISNEKISPRIFDSTIEKDRNTVVNIIDSL